MTTITLTLQVRWSFPLLLGHASAGLFAIVRQQAPGGPGEELARIPQVGTEPVTAAIEWHQPLPLNLVVELYLPGRKLPIASSKVHYGVQGKVPVAIDYPDPYTDLAEYERVAAILNQALQGRLLAALPTEERAALPRMSGLDEPQIARLAAAQARAAELAALLRPAIAGGVPSSPAPVPTPAPATPPPPPAPGKPSAAAQVAAAVSGALGKKAEEAAKKAAEELRRAAEEAARKAKERPVLDLVPPLYALIAAHGDSDLPTLLLRSRTALTRALIKAGEEKVIAALPPAAAAAVVDALVAGRDLLHFNLADDGRFADAKAIAWAPVEPAVKSRLLDALLDTGGPAAALEAVPGLTAAQKILFGEIFALSAATDRHAPMLAALSNEFPIFKRGLAGLDQDHLHTMTAENWRSLARASGFPAAYRTQPDGEAAFGASIAGAIAAGAPGRNLAARFAASPIPGTTALARTLAAHPGFDIRTQPVQGYFASPDIAVSARPNDAQLGRLAAYQRAIQLAPGGDFAVAEAMIANDYTSGYKLLLDGKAQVQTKLGPLMGADAAGTVYGKAQQLFGDVYALSLSDRYQWGPFTGTFATFQLPGPALPNLTTLFGNADFCACAHCQSVYGPAAYLADLLNWMRTDVVCLHDAAHQPSQGPDTQIHSAYDELVRRRPDIPNIMLNCSNANVAMPYIDLVNEVLAYPLLPAGTGPKLGDLQTHGDTAVRRLEPEHRAAFAPAHALLLQSYVRWTLPYDPVFDEARAYLDELGLDHAALVDALSARGWKFRSGVERESWARARFGIVPEEFAVIIAASPGTAYWKTHWGLASPPGAMVKPLLDTGEFEDLESLEALLRTSFVRAAGASFAFDRIAFDKDAPCDVDKARLVKADGSDLALDPAAAHRAMRFTRLRRRAGLTIAELDHALAAFGPGGIDSGFVCRLAAASAAAERLALPLERLLGWFDKSAADADAQFAKAVNMKQPDFNAAIKLVASGPTLPWWSPDLTWQLLHDLDRLRGIAVAPAELLAMLEGQGDWSLDSSGRATDKAFARLAQDAWTAAKAALAPIPPLPSSGAAIQLSPAAAAALKAQRDAALDLALATAVGLPVKSVTAMINAYNSVIFASLTGPAWRARFDQGVAAWQWGPPAASDVEPSFTELFRYLARSARLVKALDLDEPGTDLLVLLAVIGPTGGSWIFSGEFPVALDWLMNRFGAATGYSAAPTLFWIARAVSQAEALDMPQRIFFGRANELAKPPMLTPFVPRIVSPFSVWAKTEMGPASVLDGLSPVQLQDLADQAKLFEPTSDLGAWLARILDLSALLDAAAPITSTQLIASVWSQVPKAPTVPGIEKRFSATEAGLFRTALKVAAGGDSGWAARCQPVQDRLRRNLRDALVAYHLGKGPHSGIPQLYAHFLIDPEMQPCMQTSRIVQATNACQTLIQRGLLGLEPEVCMDEGDKKEWQWRRNYRVWEANRKVFLYPENWIDPSLRLVKTPLFAEAQERLLQDELNAANVEKAFKGYLSGLQDVSRLDIRGVYYDDAEGVSHVFGRSWNPPFEHFYRQKAAGRWTAWQSIPLDIESDHLIPIVFNRRLYLFWPTFTEKEHRRIKYGDDRGAPFVEVRLCYSKLEFGKWTPKKQYQNFWIAGSYSGSGLFDYPEGRLAPVPNVFLLPVGLQPKDFYFWAEPSGYDLIIHMRRWYNDFANVYHFMMHDVDLVISGCDDRLEFRRCSVTETSSSTYYIARPFPTIHSGTQLIQNGPGSSGISVRLDNSYGTNTHSSRSVFMKAHFPCIFTFAHQYRDADTSGPFFLADRRHTHIVTRLNNNFMSMLDIYTVQLHEHPHCCLMLRELHREGVEGLLAPKGKTHPLRRQQADQDYFAADYQPAMNVAIHGRPVLDFDFGYLGPYSAYNWEIFFHLPALIGHQLRLDGKHAEALRWLSFIFDPTNRDEDLGGARFWGIKPFFKHITEGSIDGLMRLLQSSAPQDQAKRDALAAQIAEWRKQPFQPHAVAEMRIQAYMRWTVMEYIDTLIDWGDKLFRQFTTESVNEALQLYMLASEILGPEPRQVAGAKPAERTFLDLVGSLDAFSNAAATLENTLVGTGTTGGGQTAVSPTALYFCIPENPQLLAYWDKVADRLFKIRHCRTIKGDQAELALFAPPIDPALLVKAVASGLDLSEVLDSLAAPNPRHRFSYLLQRATDFCSEVKSLGGQLLSTLEKRDAEDLSDLRQVHEINLLGATRGIKKMAVEEAKQSLAAAQYTKKLAETRRDHYSSLQFMIAEESSAKALTDGAHNLQIVEHGLLVLSGVLALFEMDSGSSGNGVHFTKKIDPAKAIGMAGQAAGAMASTMLNKAGRALTSASYVRRAEDWRLQTGLATQEIQQADRQIAAAEIRLAMAEKELDIHDIQIEQSRAVHDWMRSKFTNEQLYGWMAGKLKTLHREAYKLAFDLALQAQRAFKIELGRDETFVEFGDWDSSRQGLLAGDMLGVQLRELEAAYMRLNPRDFELSRSFSLRLLEPTALIELLRTGRAQFEIPQWLLGTEFEDGMKLYAMRIKSIALSLPCVTGPHTPANVKLRLLKSWVGWAPGDDAPPLDSLPDPDMASEIVTSTAVNDPALFEPNLRDERYLPVENAGAVSRWEVSLPITPEFDYQTISDLILHMRFVAKGQVGTSVPVTPPAKPDPKPDILASWRHDFPDQWTALLSGLRASATATNSQHTASFALPQPSRSALPYRLRASASTAPIQTLTAWILYRDAAGIRSLSKAITLTGGTTTDLTVDIAALPSVSAPDNRVLTATDLSSAPTLTYQSGSGMPLVEDILIAFKT